MTIAAIQQEIIEEFAFFEDWQQRYEYIIEMGKSLPAFSDEEKKEEYLIKGCQSQVWLKAEYVEEKVVFHADSDAILPKGIAALLVRVYSDQTPEAIIESDESFLQTIGLQEFLSPTRANGTLAMIKQIKLYALAFSAQK